jgi:hypothetical protein
MPFTCHYCKITVDTNKKLQQHCDTAKHLKNVSLNKSQPLNVPLELFNNFCEKIEREVKINRDLIEKQKKDNDELRRRIRKLESARKVDIIERLEKENDMPLRAFGQENLDFIPENIAHNLMSKCTFFVRDMLKQVHFNEDHPENHNIVIRNKNKTTIQYWNGEDWVSNDKNEFLNEFIEMTFTKFDEIFAENFKEKYASSFFVQRWINKVEQVTDSENKYHTEVMIEEVEKINDEIVGFSDRLKTIKKDIKETQRKISEEKYLMHLEIYEKEFARRETIKKECEKNGDELPIFKETLEDFARNYVKEHFK